MDIKEFNLEVLTPDRVFFKGDIESLVVTTQTGEMGVLFQTLPTVAILTAGILKINQRGKWTQAVAGEGFINISRDGVTVLIESASWPYEISEEQVKGEIDQLSSIERRAKSYQEYRMAKAQLALQFVKLKIKDKKL